MKLTMKNQYSLQKSMGYEDDPDAMTEEEVIEQLKYWAFLLSYLDAEEGFPHGYEDLAYLVGFVKELADSEVEYSKPLKTYSYHAGFEYYHNFEVVAESEEQADEMAKRMFRKIHSKLPTEINEVKGCFTYLEQNFGNEYRIVEG